MISARVQRWNKIVIKDYLMEILVRLDGNMIHNQDITRKVGDTNRIYFELIDENAEPHNLNGWSTFILTVHTRDAPSDGTTQVFQDSGTITEAVNGKGYFSPPGTSSAGKYWYDMRATKDTGEIITFSEGKYIIQETRSQ